MKRLTFAVLLMSAVALVFVLSHNPATTSIVTPIRPTPIREPSLTPEPSLADRMLLRALRRAVSLARTMRGSDYVPIHELMESLRTTLVTEVATGS